MTTSHNYIYGDYPCYFTIRSFFDVEGKSHVDRTTYKAFTRNGIKYVFDISPEHQRVISEIPDCKIKPAPIVSMSSALANSQGPECDFTMISTCVYGHFSETLPVVDFKISVKELMNCAISKARFENLASNRRLTRVETAIIYELELRRVTEPIRRAAMAYIIAKSITNIFSKRDGYKFFDDIYERLFWDEFEQRLDKYIETEEITVEKTDLVKHDPAHLRSLYKIYVTKKSPGVIFLECLNTCHLYSILYHFTAIIRSKKPSDMSEVIFYAMHLFRSILIENEFKDMIREFCDIMCYLTNDKDIDVSNIAVIAGKYWDDITDPTKKLDSGDLSDKLIEHVFDSDIPAPSFF